MNASDLQQLLHGIRRGDIDPDQAASDITAAMARAPFEDLGFARLDTHRAWRQGFPEVIFGLGKSPAQIAALAERVASAGQTLLITRANRSAFEAVRACVPAVVYHDIARTISLKRSDIPPGRGTVLIACAGTSDLPVAEEAAVTADLMGNVVDRLNDVGVAGIHRLICEQSRLQQARVIVVVAGMEGALPSIVAGLVQVPVIAVPTSIGYGASFSGIAPLLGMLNSCANGVAVVNIDNGFGAACVASAINHLQ